MEGMSATGTSMNDDNANAVHPHIDTDSLPFVETLYLEYLADPESVPEAWQKYFRSNGAAGAGPSGGFRPSFNPGTLFNPPGRAPGLAEAEAESSAAALQHRVDKLVRNYRVRGHRVADVNPLAKPVFGIPELEPSYYGFTEADMDRHVLSENMPGVSTLRELIEGLQATYTRSIGAQFMHIDNLAVRSWLQARMEQTRNRRELSRETQIRILTRLTDATIFEEFIQTKFVGAKSFSLEGGESLIPLLDLAIEKAGAQGERQVLLGMAHRGRLNVLANIMGKSPRKIFREFEDIDPELQRGRGDVKYHLGESHDWVTQAGDTLHLSLAFNPSHLEFVNPVVLGRTRAKQDRMGDTQREQGLAILIHGDAAFIGEGIVQETLNLSELPGYRVGGALHVIVNNQIGFTTTPDESRSTTYSSDIAKMLQSPIFHVNGEDPEAVAQVIELAMDFRSRFKRDVVIDMYCYRRHGHNEGDDPSFTQPAMYELIRKRPPMHETYLARLLELGGITADEARRITETRLERLEEELATARREDFTPHYSALEGVWSPYLGGPAHAVSEVDTGIPLEEVGRLLTQLGKLPADFTPNPRLKRMLDTRAEIAAGRRPLDWAAAELLAYASLLVAGTRVRLSGQDSQRGTFVHRHSVLHDVITGQQFMPLAHLSPDQAPVEIINSPLSEAGVLGFEYGYSLDTPDALVMWEAQFGDFVNTAQVIIDQFIASAEEKWNRLSGLVMLLPHGHEGAGPEHSSARLERFLQLCADDNMQVVNPTTPAQMFHVLRRQVLRPLRKPLIVMSPKSLLRHPQVVSQPEEFASGQSFKRILPDDLDPAGVSRILLCSGKLYYELLAERSTQGRTDVAIIRLEQLYPLPDDELAALLAAYEDGTPVTWVQEESRNAGAWWFLLAQWGADVHGHPLTHLSRPASASPATGSASSHRLEQAELIRAAFDSEG
jgi:2-oxoglutarate dehydrogenase E1 component